MTEPFENYQICLAKFEKNWTTPRGVGHLENALEIYIDLKNEKDDRFDNLIQVYAKDLEKKVKELFDFPEVDGDQYINSEFLKTITKELGLFTQFQSSEEGFGRPIRELICLLALSHIEIFSTLGKDRSLDDRRQSIHNLSDRVLKDGIGALQKISRL